jgi:hypothetical protein
MMGWINEKHPWQDFLDARCRAIFWMKNEMNRDDKKIAADLSMDEHQVYLIRTHPCNQRFGSEKRHTEIVQPTQGECFKTTHWMPLPTPPKEG